MDKYEPSSWAAFTDDSVEPPHTNIVSFSPRTDCIVAMPGRHKKEPVVRLIASAPAMLALLREWAGDSCGCETFTCNGSCLPARTRNVIDQFEQPA